MYFYAFYTTKTSIKPFAILAIDDEWDIDDLSLMANCLNALHVERCEKNDFL